MNVMMSTKKKEKRLQVTSEKTFHICELTHPAQKQEQEDTHKTLFYGLPNHPTIPFVPPN